MISGGFALIYLGAVVTALFLFGKHYKAKKLHKLQNIEQFFPNKFNHDIYHSLAKQEGIPDRVLNAALLCWAAESVGRKLQLSENAPILKSLNDNGLIDDDLVTQFTGTERLLMAELQQIGEAAQGRVTGWAQTVLPSSQDVVNNKALRQRLQNIDSFRQEFEEQMLLQ